MRDVDMLNDDISIHSAPMCGDAVCGGVLGALGIFLSTPHLCAETYSS